MPSLIALHRIQSLHILGGLEIFHWTNLPDSLACYFYHRVPAVCQSRIFFSGPVKLAFQSDNVTFHVCLCRQFSKMTCNPNTEGAKRKYRCSFLSALWVAVIGRWICLIALKILSCWYLKRQTFCANTIVTKNIFLHLTETFDKHTK